MPTERWKGTTAIKEAPSSPVFENTKDGPRYTRTFNGPYTALLGNTPARLGTMTGVPSGFYVDTVRVEKAPGNRGIMTVTLTPAPIQDYTFEANQTLEVEYVEIQKRIETHPMFNAVTAESSHPNAGKYELTDDDLDAIEEWKNQTTATDRKTKYDALSDNAKALAQRIKRGQDSYVIYAPVCRVTKKNATKPLNTRCGFQDDPPAGVKVDGYSYLQTADRATRDRTWSRIQEWTGADEIDTEVYAG